MMRHRNVVVIRGGLPGIGESDHATILGAGAVILRRAADEPPAAFRERAAAQAVAEPADFVVFGGLPEEASAE